MAAFREDFLSKDDFEADLAILCCYDYGANGSEAVEKFAIDEKAYHKCSLCIKLHSHSIFQ